MKTFLKVALITFAVAAAALLAPGLVFPLGGGVAGIMAAFAACIFVGLLSVALGAVALVAALLGLIVAAVVLLAVSAPVWMPLLLLAGFITLIVKLASPRRPTAAPVSVA